MHCGHRSSHRPETEEENDDSKPDCENIDQNTERFWKMKWAPDELIRLVRVRVAWWSDSPSEATPKEETLRDDVGSVKAADAERDDVVKCGGRADVD